MDPADHLVALLGAGDPPLDEALLAVAALRPGPPPDAEEALAELDRLAAGCGEPTLDGVARQLFRDEGFRGDTDDYHHPDNSMLDVVLRRRRGMPITLSAVTIEVGRRLGVPLSGVGMPGHFLVRDRVLPDVFVDPFDAGRRLDVAGCRALFARIHGPATPFDDAYLEPVGSAAVVARVLNNLTVAYRRRDPEALDRILDVRLRLPLAAPERRALAELLTARGRYDDAADVLDGGETPDPATSRRLRARLN